MFLLNMQDVNFSTQTVIIGLYLFFFSYAGIVQVQYLMEMEK